MNEKKTLLVDKSRMPLAMGIAFVAFTTQFGGGFASGAQIYQYFINYGIWCLILPALTQGLYALFFWYGMRYAYKHKTYDYRSFSNSLYGRTRPVMSNLYEICYLIMIGTASAAAFATGGSLALSLTVIPLDLIRKAVSKRLPKDRLRRVEKRLTERKRCGMIKTKTRRET